MGASAKNKCWMTHTTMTYFPVEKLSPFKYYLHTYHGTKRKQRSGKPCKMHSIQNCLTIQGMPRKLVHIYMCMYEMVEGECDNMNDRMGASYSYLILHRVWVLKRVYCCSNQKYCKRCAWKFVHTMLGDVYLRACWYQHVEPTHRYPTVYQTHCVVVPHECAQIGRLYWWRWRDVSPWILRCVCVCLAHGFWRLRLPIVDFRTHDSVDVDSRPVGKGRIL